MASPVENAVSEATSLLPVPRDRELRRAAAIADLRALTSTQYVVACTTEATTVSGLFLPYYFIFFAARGALNSRRLPSGNVSVVGGTTALPM